MPAPARSLAAAALALSVMAVERGAGTAGQAALVEPASFHHLHLVSGGPAWLASYYASLFAPDSVTRGVFWSFEGVRGADAYLLVSRLEGGRNGEANSAIWHFGWGRVSLGETYRGHYVKEVNWRPPYAGLEADFHVHLRSRDPLRAGRWYRDVLGGTLEESPPLERSITEDERVDALVRFRSVLLALHRWSGPLVSTSEAGSVDHLAFLVRDPSRVLEADADAAKDGSRTAVYALPSSQTWVMEGPDRILIELLQAGRGPAFWTDRPR